MHYDFIAIPDADVPRAVEATFQHILTTYASEANKTVGVWRAVPDDLLDFKPHEKTNPIRTILGHQRLVAGEPALLRRLAAGADLGVLAASPAHLASPDPGADMVAVGRPRAGPGHLRAFGRREVG